MHKIKPIRSFVKRQRKLPPNKQKIFDEMWANHGLNISSGEISSEKAFCCDAPLVLEIGFGMGLTILNSAQKNPEQNFIGVEVYQPGIGNLLTQLKTQELNNVRIYNEDAVIVLNKCIPNNSLEKVLIFFPDPWPKKRHNKRRLIQSSFAELLHKKLKPKGILHIATDCEDYANHAMDTLNNNSDFTSLTDAPEALQISSERTSTKFEQRGKKLGHKIFDLVFITN
jgi:tRNA (guanine-N7-)-methyltransferase